MARDSSLFVRKATMALLKSDAGVTALVPATSIFPATVISDPAYPLIVYGDGDSTPLRRSCVDGMTLPISFTAYARPRYEKSQMVETAEDVARKIAAAISAALDRKKLILATDYEAQAYIRWQSGVSRRAGVETDTWQAIVRFTARVIS